MSDQPLSRLSDLLLALTSIDMPDKVRTTLTSDIHCLARYLGRHPELLPVNTGALRHLLANLNLRRLGITRARLRNVLSSVHRAAALTGLRTSQLPEPPPGTEWALWIARLQSDLRPDSRWRAVALAAFFRHLAIERIPLAKVDADVLDRHCATMSAWLPHRSPSKRAVNIRAAWNHACKAIEDWPGRPIMSKRPGPRAMPLDDLPPALREDIDAYITAKGCRLLADLPVRDPDDDLAHLKAALHSVERVPRAEGKKAQRPLRKDTLAQHRYLLRHLAGLLLTGGRVQSQHVRGIGDLITPAAVSTFLARQAKRNVAPGTILVQATALRDIAARWTGLSAEDLHLINEMLGIQRALVPKGMSERPRDRLNDLIASDAIPELIRLPGILFLEAELARKAGRVTWRHALNVKVAVVLTVLFACPIRRKNIAELTIDSHIRLPHRRGQAGYISIDGAEIKNGNSMIAPIDPDKAVLLRAYLAHYRPLLGPGPDNVFLFPSRCGSGHISRVQIGRLVSQTVEQRLRLPVNLHLFRTIAATLLFAFTDGNRTAVSALLGHDPDEKTWQAYTQIAQTWATSKYGEALKEEARGSGLLTSRAQTRRTNARRVQS